MRGDGTASTRPRVLAVFTGGTISMTVIPGRGAVPARSGAEILALIPGASDCAEVEVEDFDRIPGPHWTPDRMLALARYLDDRLLRDGFAGAVVTHGTDTLEETAYLLDLVLATRRPVILTGAMRTADDPWWDGPRNLLAAIRCAAAPEAAGLGVAVVFDGAILAGAEAQKVHTDAFAAFGSPRGRAIGTVGADGVTLLAPPPPRERIPTERIEADVALVAAAVGIDGRLLRRALEEGARGIVIEALGRGNVPPAMLPAVREATARGVPVVVASRCLAGATGPTYGYEGGGRTLLEAGAVFAGDLPAAKARVKLMVLLGSGAGPEAVRRAFAT